MGNELRFDGKVAIVTGAGNGLGRAHALLLASRGAQVVVNDLGGTSTGGGKSSAAADAVVQEIKAAGGQAVANYDSVEDGAKIVQQALDSFKRLDIVVNNAGILRDTTFHKMTQEDWDLIYRVHVLGGFRVTHAAWNHLRDQGYGRVVFTASAAGLYGNFGQANYGMAKLGLVGLANTLALEGAKKNVRVNVIAPLAGSRLTETVLPKELVEQLKPEYVSPLVAWLCHESCEETGGLFEVGGGYVGKLRWERTVGKAFKLGKALTVEAVRDGWGAVTDFSKTTHPSNVNEALAPAIENLSAAPSKGGNEFIDVDQALGHQFPEVKTTYAERDLALYALGIGAGQNPLDPDELKTVYELYGDGFVPLPTWAVVPAVSNLLNNAAKEGKMAPGLNYGLDRVLHGEQFTEVYRPLPAKGTLKHQSRVKDIFDKGKHALVIVETRSFDDATGEELFKNEITIFVRGAGGWGGTPSPDANVNVAPDRAPDAVITEKTSPGQALLYRLSGDWNPLHADPDFAKAFGFERPILHGLCTFGYVGRHVIKAFAKGDPRLFKSIKVRFADTVYPGETLKTEMWKDGERVLLRCSVVERNKVVISNAAVELYPQVPVAKAKPAEVKAPAAVAPAAAAGEVSSAAIFDVIGRYVAQTPELVSKVATVYHFNLKSPDSQWTLDLKNGKGAVAKGAQGKADCTLDIDDADWIAMATGKADPQKLYFSKKLKIGGNVLASQKLDFLKKIDAAKVMAPAAGAAPAAPATPAAPAPARSGPLASGIFKALGERIAKSPGLVKEVGGVLQFKVRSPDTAWVVNLKDGAGGVTPGADPKAGLTLTLADEDLGELARTGAVKELFMHGKLRLDGDIALAHRLTFFKQLA